ncbi:hypothetical protein [Microbacterium kyungheense]|uniref:Excreted virulence factor EspC (Type VII ESX diderm) n=1 Tax=Microbacterium kyungheense TaxID=1263636 RepID=A0A543FJR4_9MICO|nr:hypothetical protein [Microbacterium kyungheense]TQM34119.1 hypothetical protein FB391_0406 [Microbacterium kyungheense]
MPDVEVYYHELTSAATAVQTASQRVLEAAADLNGDDVGIGNPAHRPSLRLEMHRRFTALRTSVRDHSAAASGVGGDVQAIADKYSELDAELSG